MFYSDTQSFLNFLRIVNRLEVGVFAQAVKLHSPGIFLASWPFVVNKILYIFFFAFIISFHFVVPPVTSSIICFLLYYSQRFICCFMFVVVPVVLLPLPLFLFININRTLLRPINA
jgi:hypothetical protein